MDDPDAIGADLDSRFGGFFGGSVQAGITDEWQHDAKKHGNLCQTDICTGASEPSKFFRPLNFGAVLVNAQPERSETQRLDMDNEQLNAPSISSSFSFGDRMVLCEFSVLGIGKSLELPANGTDVNVDLALLELRPGSLNRCSQ